MAKFIITIEGDDAGVKGEHLDSHGNAVVDRAANALRQAGIVVASTSFRRGGETAGETFEERSAAKRKDRLAASKSTGQHSVHPPTDTATASNK